MGRRSACRRRGWRERGGARWGGGRCVGGGVRASEAGPDGRRRCVGRRGCARARQGPMRRRRHVGGGGTRGGARWGGGRRVGGGGAATEAGPDAAALGMSAAGVRATEAGPDEAVGVRRRACERPRRGVAGPWAACRRRRGARDRSGARRGVGRGRGGTRRGRCARDRRGARRGPRVRVRGGWRCSARPRPRRASARPKRSRALSWSAVSAAGADVLGVSAAGAGVRATEAGSDAAVLGAPSSGAGARETVGASESSRAVCGRRTPGSTCRPACARSRTAAASWARLGRAGVPAAARACARARREPVSPRAARSRPEPVRRVSGRSSPESSRLRCLPGTLRMCPPAPRSACPPWPRRACERSTPGRPAGARRRPVGSSGSTAGCVRAIDAGAVPLSLLAGGVSAGAAAGVRAIDAGAVPPALAGVPVGSSDAATAGVVAPGSAGVRATDGKSAGGRVERRRATVGAGTGVSSTAGSRTDDEVSGSGARDQLLRTGRGRGLGDAQLLGGERGAARGPLDDPGASGALEAAAGAEARELLLLGRLGHLLGLRHADQIRARGLLVAEHPRCGEVAHLRRRPRGAVRAGGRGSRRRRGLVQSGSRRRRGGAGGAG